jgi:hypothetical protein
MKTTAQASAELQRAEREVKCDEILPPHSTLKYLHAIAE